MTADFADSECEASANPVTVRGHGVPVYCNCMMRLYQQILQNHLAKKRKKYYTLDMLA